MRFIIIFLSLMAQNCLSQNVFSPFRVFSTAEGLNNNQVNCICKDARGFIWTGTAEGLYRFDGFHFKQYYSDIEDNNSLSGNYILDLLEYQPGKLLIATNNGLSILNTFTNNFENNLVRLPSLLKGNGTLVNSLFKDINNRIWINYRDGIDVFNDSLKLLFRLTDLPWAASLKGIKIFYEKWFQDKNGLVWLPSDNYGICIVDEKNKTVFNWNNNPNHYPFLKKFATRSFFLDTIQNQIWYSFWGNGLECFDFSSGKHRVQLFGIQYPTEARCINSILLEKDGSLICAGGLGIYSVNTKSLAWTLINKKYSGANLPDAFGGVVLFSDRDNNVWVGTNSLGLLEMPVRNKNVRQFSIPEGLLTVSNLVYCSDILRYNHDIFYMAYGLNGLIELNISTCKFKNYKINSLNGNPLDAFKICRAPGGKLWIGTGLGIYLFDISTKKIIYSANLTASTKDLTVSCMILDKENNMWIAFRGTNALGYYNQSEKKFSYYKDYLYNGEKLLDKQNLIAFMQMDAHGDIWMASDEKGGFISYRQATKQWDAYPKKASKYYQLLTDNPIACLAPGNNHELWFSFQLGNGIVKYDYAKDSIWTFTYKNGLLSNNISALDKDNKNNLLAVSANGINYFNPISQETKTLGFSNVEKNWVGLNNQFYDSTYNQILYAPGKNILLVNNNFLQADTQSIRVYIESIKVNNTSEPFNLSALKLQLKYNEKNISISFIAPDFSNASVISYSYMLKGLDKHWVFGNSLSTANYLNIPPGNYTFLVRAKKQSGNWGQVNDELHIIVQPAIWQTWWFQTFIAAFIISTTYWLLHRRIVSIRKSAELRQKIAETEMMMLRAQMNPHFIFNCLNAIDNLIHTNQKDKATTYLARFAKLIRSVLDSSKNNLVSFQKDYETMQLYLQLEQFRCNNKFRYKLIADQGLLNGDYKVPPLLIQPFLENAIHHGLLNKQVNDRYLFVTISLENDFIKYNITDNGVGRERAQELKTINRPEHISYGIQISKERVHLYNGQNHSDNVLITDLTENGKATGTKVEVKIKNYDTI